MVAGEARVFEATLQYEVEDGHYIYLEGFEIASVSAPDCGTFTFNLNISEADLPNNAPLMLILFEESAMDDSRVNELFVELDTFN